MPKNIVICSDGTGNADIKGRGTNVFKMFEAIDVNGHRTDAALDPQIAFYDDGVGTEDLKPLKTLGGAVGLGLARNVRQLYRSLARVYDDGDRIFLFGFSRGAFTVRTLAGMIDRCGILNASDVSRLTTTRAVDDAVDRTYDAYRAGYDSVLTRVVGSLLGWPDRATAVDRLHRDYPFHPRGRIAFVGVWDTVDAVGTPFGLSAFVNTVIYQFKFGTQDLSPSVDRACHALAIDDKRASFTPVLWTEMHQDGRAEQVWFAGAHSNVGGGYPKQGMSLVAFEWMLRHASGSGLRVQSLDAELYSGHASVDDKLYDPRAGRGVFFRWEPRDITTMCRDHGVKPKVHLSVVERIAHATEAYAPGNLPLHADIVITPTGDARADEVALARAKAVKQVLSQASLERSDLLPAVRSHIVMAQVSYWIFVGAWLLLLAGAVGVTMQAPTSLKEVVRVSGQVVKSVLTLDATALWEVGAALVVSPWRLTLEAAVLAFVVAWWLSRRSDRGMSAVFSAFWHWRQPQLRDALKRARQEMK